MEPKYIVYVPHSPLRMSSADFTVKLKSCRHMMRNKKWPIVFCGYLAVIFGVIGLLSSFSLGKDRRSSSLQPTEDSLHPRTDNNDDNNNNHNRPIVIFAKADPNYDETAKENLTIEVPHRFIYDLKIKAVAVNSKHSDFLLFTLINRAYLKLTLNWLCNVAGFDKYGSIHQRLLIVSMDNTSCEVIGEHWPEVACIFLDLSTDGDGVDGDGDGDGDNVDLRTYNKPLKWGKQAYINILTIRAQLMLALAQVRLAYVLFETDAVWFRDPIKYFADQTLVDDADLVVPLKGYPDHSLTLSFDPMIVYPTDTSLKFLSYFSDTLLNDSSLFDQDLLDQLCKQMYYGLICRQFPWEDVSDGLWFKKEPRDRKLLRPYIVNNNYYVGVDNKITRQALNGLWFLDVKGRCNEQKVKIALESYGAENFS